MQRTRNVRKALAFLCSLWGEYLCVCVRPLFLVYSVPPVLLCLLFSAYMAYFLLLCCRGTGAVHFTQHTLLVWWNDSVLCILCDKNMAIWNVAQKKSSEREKALRAICLSETNGSTSLAARRGLSEPQPCTTAIQAEFIPHRINYYSVHIYVKKYFVQSFFVFALRFG